jgi:hypothetical protein
LRSWWIARVTCKGRARLTSRPCRRTGSCRTTSGARNPSPCVARTPAISLVIEGVRKRKPFFLSGFLVGLFEK